MQCQRLNLAVCKAIALLGILPLQPDSVVFVDEFKVVLGNLTNGVVY